MKRRHRLANRPSGRTFSNRGSHFPNDSGLCHVDTKPARKEALMKWTKIAVIHREQINVLEYSKMITECNRNKKSHNNKIHVSICLLSNSISVLGFCIETVMCIPGWSQTHSAAETALNFWSSHLYLPNAKIKEVCSHTWASNSTHTLLLHNRLLKKAMGLARPKTERKIFIPQYGTGKGPQVLSPKPPSHLHCPWLTSHPSSPPSTRGQCPEEHGHIYSSHLSSAVIWDKRSFSTPFTLLL